MHTASVMAMILLQRLFFFIINTFLPFLFSVLSCFPPDTLQSPFSYDYPPLSLSIIFLLLLRTPILYFSRQFFLSFFSIIHVPCHILVTFFKLFSHFSKKMTIYLIALKQASKKHIKSCFFIVRYRFYFVNIIF